MKLYKKIIYAPDSNSQVVQHMIHIPFYKTICITIYNDRKAHYKKRWFYSFGRVNSNGDDIRISGSNNIINR